MAPIGKPKRVTRRPVPVVNPAIAPEKPKEEPLFVPKEEPIVAPNWITAPSMPIPVEIPQKTN